MATNSVARPWLVQNRQQAHNGRRISNRWPLNKGLKGLAHMSYLNEISKLYD